MAEESKNTSLYLRIDGREHGPMTVEEVKAWIDQGKFRRTDYIRMEDKKAWVKAENVVHLKALFDEAKAKVTRGAFDSWLTNVKTGETPMVLSAAGRVAEQKRIDDEQEALTEERGRLEAEEKELRAKLEREVAQSQRELERLQEEREEAVRRLGAERDEEVKKLEAERETVRQRLIAEREAEVKKLAEESDRELARMAGARDRLDQERARLAEEEKELATMGKAVRARRRLPLVVTGIVVVAAIFIGVPSYYFFILKPQQEIQEKLGRISDLETRMTELAGQLEAALKVGDTAKAEKIAKEIEKVKAEKEKLAGEVPKENVPKLNTSAGKARLAGLLRVEGDGATEPSRSESAIGAGLSAGMGNVRATYSRELGKTPGLAGHVIVSLTIAADGSVTRASVVSSTIGNSAVESAVKGAARGANFAAAAGETTCTYKFDFAP